MVLDLDKYIFPW